MCVCVCVFSYLVAIGNVPDNREGSNMCHHYGNQWRMQSIKHWTVFRHLLCHQPPFISYIIVTDSVITYKNISQNTLILGSYLLRHPEKKKKRECWQRGRRQLTFCDAHTSVMIWVCRWEVFLCAVGVLEITPERCTVLSMLIHLLPQAYSCTELSFNDSQGRGGGSWRGTHPHLVKTKNSI